MDENKNYSVDLSAMGFPNDNMDDFLFAYEMEDRVSGSESTSRTVGIIGQLSYMYDMRFSVDFSIRGDLSSQFGANTGMAPFWAVVGMYTGKNGCKIPSSQTWCYADHTVSRDHKVIPLTRRKRLTRTMICCSPIRLRIYWERS